MAASASSQNELKARFHRAMRDIYETAKRDLGYNATRFLGTTRPGSAEWLKNTAAEKRPAAYARTLNLRKASLRSGRRNAWIGRLRRLSYGPNTRNSSPSRSGWQRRVGFTVRAGLLEGHSCYHGSSTMPKCSRCDTDGSAIVTVARDPLTIEVDTSGGATVRTL